MPIGNYDLFIFDWDGTLSTSTSLVRATRLLNRRYNPRYIKEHSKEYQADLDSGVVGSESVSDFYSALYDIYSKFSRPRLQPGALLLLQELKKAGKKIAVFSDSNMYRLIKEIKLLGVTDYFDLVISARAIKKYKPNPDGLLLIIDKFKESKGRSVYIGDMASDVLTARFAGITIWSVCNGVDPYRLIKEAKPDQIFKNLQELLANLKAG